MARSTSSLIPVILLHVFLTMITGGAWLVVLFIWFILKKS